MTSSGSSTGSIRDVNTSGRTWRSLSFIYGVNSETYIFDKIMKDDINVSSDGRKKS